MFRLTGIDPGQTSTEHIGMIVVVVAIVGALVAAGVTTELGQTFSNKVCQAFGGSCGTSGGGSGQTSGGTGGTSGEGSSRPGWPTQWKKGAKVAKDMVKHGKDVISGAIGICKAKKKVDRLRKKVDDLKKKLPKKEKNPKDGEKPKELACGVNHSFLPGTLVLSADGTRRAIECVEVGQRVTVTDPVTGVTTSRPVTATINTHDDKHFTRMGCRRTVAERR